MSYRWINFDRRNKGRNEDDTGFDWCISSRLHLTFTVSEVFTPPGVSLKDNIVTVHAVLLLKAAFDVVLTSLHHHHQVNI